MEDPLLPVSSPVAEDEAAPASTTDVVAVSTAPSPVPTSVVLVRLASIAALAFLSLWANYEASRGFDVSIVNGAAGTAAGRRFDLMFVSNGRASRAIHDASRAVESTLYSIGGGTNEAKKPVQQVTLRLADGNLSAGVVVTTSGENQFLLHVSSGVMLAADADAALRAAVRRGMARVWLWDGQGAAPEALLDAMAEYLAGVASLDGASRRDPAGSGDATSAMVEGEEKSLCWPGAAQGRDAAARFVRQCEVGSRGFVARLNEAMRWRWRPRMVEEALGPSAWLSCGRQSASAWSGGAASPVGDGGGGWRPEGGHVTSQGWASGC